MKKSIFLVSLVGTALIYGQNLSRGVVADNALPATDARTFQFGTGIISQLQSGTFGDFTNSTWLSLGSLNTGSQTVYGLRFQLPNKALTFGYKNITDVNPRIEWNGTGSSLGNLEFRSANSFTSTTSNLIATMNNNGNTVFGNNRSELNNGFQRIGIDYGYGYAIKALNDDANSSLKLGVYVENKNGGSTTSVGVSANVTRDLTAGSGGYYQAIKGTASNGNINYGVQGIADGGTASYGILGQASTSNPNYYAGYFDGKVYVGSLVMSSDAKLKKEIKNEDGMLDKIKKLRAVNYNYDSRELNLPKERQHGFIAQEIEKIFPELVTTVRQPILDENIEKEGSTAKEPKINEFKAVNYIGLISVLTSSLQELDKKYENEILSLRKEIEELKNEKQVSKISSNNDYKDYEMSQNVPNPFEDETKITYTLPNKQQFASIGIFDLTGKLLKEYKLNNQRGEIIIKSSEVGKGMFLYVLMNNNMPLISKKMIIK